MARYFDVASSHLNPKLLARKMQLQQWDFHVFGAMVGPMFVKNGGTYAVPISPTGPQLTGAPIELFSDFIANGRTDLDIPVRKRLLGRPVFGDSRVKGTGEKTNVVFRTVPINISRFAWQPPTLMSEQISRPYADQIINNGQAQLQDLINNYWPGNLMCSMMAGFSYDIAAPATMQGRAKGIISHPNLWVAGSGLVSYGSGRPGTVGYEGSVAADLDGLADTSECKMSVKLLRKLRVIANRQRVNPSVLKGGFKFRPMFISEAQFIQLEADPEYIDLKKRYNVTPPEVESPLVNMADAYLEGFCIYVDDALWGARTATDDASVTSDVEYGPSPTAQERAEGHFIGNWVANKDQNTKKIGLILGASAISVGEGKRWKLTEEVDDHEGFREFAAAFTQSAVRADVFDLDGSTGLTAGSFDYNDSSLEFATYSPYNLDPAA